MHPSEAKGCGCARRLRFHKYLSRHRACSAMSSPHREQVPHQMSEYPYRYRTDGQDNRIPDPVSHGCRFASPRASAEKPDVHVSDQYQAYQGDPEDPIGRLEKNAPIMKNEDRTEREKNVAKEHPPEPRGHSEWRALLISHLAFGCRHKPSPNNHNLEIDWQMAARPPQRACEVWMNLAPFDESPYRDGTLMSTAICTTMSAETLQAEQEDTRSSAAGAVSSLFIVCAVGILTPFRELGPVSTARPSSWTLTIPGSSAWAQSPSCMLQGRP